MASKYSKEKSRPVRISKVLLAKINKIVNIEYKKTGCFSSKTYFINMILNSGINNYCEKNNIKMDDT